MTNTSANYVTIITGAFKVVDSSNYATAQLNAYAFSYDLVKVVLSQEAVIVNTITTTKYYKGLLGVNLFINTVGETHSELIIPEYDKVAEKYGIQQLNLQPVIQIYKL